MSAVDINKRGAAFLQIICPAHWVRLLDVVLARDSSDGCADEDGLHDVCNIRIESNGCDWDLCEVTAHVKELFVGCTEPDKVHLVAATIELIRDSSYVDIYRKVIWSKMTHFDFIGTGPKIVISLWCSLQAKYVDLLPSIDSSIFTRSSRTKDVVDISWGRFINF